MNGAAIYVLCGLLLLCPTGIVLNSLVIAISLAKNLIEGEYRWFIFSVALVDWLVYLNLSTIQLYYVVENSFDHLGCFIAGLWLQTVGTSSATLVPLISVNRWVALYYSTVYYKHVFTGPKIFIMIVVAAGLGWVTQVPNLIFGYAGDLGTGICLTSVIDLKGLLSYCLVSLPIFYGTYPVAIYSNYKIYRKLHEQSQDTHFLGSHEAESLKRNREIMKLAIAQAFLPLAFQTPIVTLTIMNKLGLHFGQANEFLAKTAILLYVSNSVVNALIALTVVKPYKKATLNFFKNLKKCKLGFHQQQVSAAATPAPQAGSSTSRINYPSARVGAQVSKF